MSASDERVLVYRLGSLGDTCVALPAFHVIRRAHPHSRITLLTNLPVNPKAAPAVALLEGTGLVDDYISYPVGTRNPWRLAVLARQLRRSHYGEVINLAPWRGARAMWRDDLFFRLAGIEKRIGFGKAEAGALRYASDGTAEPEAGRLLRRVSRLGRLELGERSAWELRLTPGELAAAAHLLKERAMPSDYFVASVGTKLQANDWEQPNWEELMKRLAVNFPEAGCVFIGSADEQTRAEACLRAWGRRGLSLCGATQPRLSAAVLAGATVFVGHDSGPMHLAACVRTPCVAIFSARNPRGQWFPAGDNHRPLYHRTDCAACGLNLCIKEAKKCILAISVQEVFDEVVGAWNDVQDRRRAV